MKRFNPHIIIKTVVGLLVLFFFSTPSKGWAQLTDTTNAGQRGAPRIEKISARSSALGDATVGDPSDISVINLNPAGLSFVPNLSTAQINISQNWNNNVTLENFTLPAFKLNNHAFAAQFSIHHDRGFNAFNLLGTNPMPEPKITMYQLDVVYSYAIINNLSIGIFNNFSHAQNSVAQYSTYYATFGLMYAPSRSLSYGLAFRGLGRSVVYNVMDANKTILGSQNLRESLELGATLHLPTNTDDTYLSLSLANEKRFGQKNIWYKAGLELTNIPYLAIRTGLLFQPETDIYAPRFGLGVISELIAVDYSISYSKELYERYHQLGITLHLNKF